MGTRSLRILRQPSLFPHSSVHLVWPCIHGGIRLLHRSRGDKPKASGGFGVWISHIHTACRRSPLLKMAPQMCIGCFKAPTSDEVLPQLFRLFGRLWLRHDSSGREDFNSPYSAASAGWKTGDELLKSFSSTAKTSNLALMQLSSLLPYHPPFLHRIPSTVLF